jgi:hypothetical protein
VQAAVLEVQVLAAVQVQVLAAVLAAAAEEVAEEHKDIKPLKIFKNVLISHYFCIHNK